MMDTHQIEVVAAELTSVIGGEARVLVNSRAIAYHQVRRETSTRILARVVDADLLHSEQQQQHRRH